MAYINKFFFICFVLCGLSQTLYGADSSTVRSKTLRLRIHALSFMPYSGRIVNNRPSADILFAYEGKYISGYIFPSSDLRTRHSDINYLQVGLYHRLKISDSWEATPYAIVEIPQNNAWFTSPYGILGASIVYHISTKWQIENTFLFADGIRRSDKLDGVHRLRIHRINTQWEWSAFLWTNSDRFDRSGYYSTAWMGTFPVLRKSRFLNLSTSVMIFHMLKRDVHVQGPKNGFLISLIAPIGFL